MEPKNYVLAVLIFVCAWRVAPAGALQIADLGSVVVTASRYQQDRRDTNQSITVVTQKDIKRKNAANVADAIRGVAGVHLVSLGSPGDDLDVRIRGSDRDEVLVMLDGMPVNNLTESRALFLNAIPVDLIERIEIVRGPQSVVYGSGALGGVINIITKKGGKKPLYGVAAQAGNLGAFRETALGAATDGREHFGLSYTRDDQKGRFANDRFAGNSFFGNYRHDLSSRARLTLQAVYFDHDQELAFGSATSFADFPIIGYYIVADDDRQLSRNIVISQAAFEAEPLDWYSLRLSYGLFYEDLGVDNSNQGEIPPDLAAALDSQQFDSDGFRHHFDLKNHFQLWDGRAFKMHLILGADGILENLHFTDNPFPGDVTAKAATEFPDASLGQKGHRRNLAGYALANAALFDRLSLSLGLRYDDNTTYGTAFSPRVSVGYYFAKTQSKIFTGYAKGFVAPTLNQYYLAVIGGTLSQKLNAEESHTFEAGIEQSLFEKLDVSATYFHVDYDTFIDQLQLINDARVNGLESALHYRPFSWLELGANYTFMRTANEEAGTELADRPRHQFSGDAIFYPLKNLQLGLNAVAVSERRIATILSTQQLGDLTLAFFDANGNPAGETLPSYYLINLAARYEQKLKAKSRAVPSLLAYSLRLSNLLNRNFQEKFGYPMPRFRFLAGLEVKY